MLFLRKPIVVSIYKLSKGQTVCFGGSEYSYELNKEYLLFDGGKYPKQVGADTICEMYGAPYLADIQDGWTKFVAQKTNFEPCEFNADSNVYQVPDFAKGTHRYIPKEEFEKDHYIIDVPEYELIDKKDSDSRIKSLLNSLTTLRFFDYDIGDDTGTLIAYSSKDTAACGVCVSYDSDAGEYHIEFHDGIHDFSCFTDSPDSAFEHIHRYMVQIAESNTINPIWSAFVNKANQLLVNYGVHPVMITKITEGMYRYTNMTNGKSFTTMALIKNNTASTIYTSESQINWTLDPDLHVEPLICMAEYLDAVVNEIGAGSYCEVAARDETNDIGFSILTTELRTVFGLKLVPANRSVALGEKAFTGKGVYFFFSKSADGSSYELHYKRVGAEHTWCALLLGDSLNKSTLQIISNLLNS